MSINQFKFQTVSASKRMRTALAVLLLVLCSNCLTIRVLAVDAGHWGPKQDRTRIAINVDPRVELIGIVFRLAGNWEYRQCKIPAYSADIERHFDNYKHHPVVELARKLRDTRGMSCDGPMSLALHIDCEFRPLKEFHQWPWGLDGRWKQEETKEFLEKLRRFAAETKFKVFFQAQHALYEKGLTSCRAVMARDDLGGWFEEYFGLTANDDLRMVLGFVNGCSNYGLRFSTATKTSKYAIVGMEFCNAAGHPFFDHRLLILAAHEFCHSFTNPIVNEYRDVLQPAGEQFFQANAPAMRRIGYQSWQSVMYETAVRACVASFTRTRVESEHPGIYELYLEREKNMGFTWIAEMDKMLYAYERDRERYSTFASFFPNWITFLEAYSKEVGS